MTKCNIELLIKTTKQQQNQNTGNRRQLSQPDPLSTKTHNWHDI